MSLTKQQLEALNNNSFPNNNAGYITPDILRQYNSAVIEALVDSNGTGSFATTGSNEFDGVQTITGSNGTLVYRGTSAGTPDGSLASIHANDDSPWLERFYNDSFSSASSVMSYFAWNDGRFVFHNDSTESIGISVNGYDNPELLVYEDKAVIKNDLFISGNVYATNLTGSTIETGSFATTGSNSFTGSQTILSGSIAVFNNGNAASLNETELSIETYTSDAYGIIAANNHSASLGIISWDGATYDNELWIQADNSGIQLTDWDNGIGNLSAVPFISVEANNGSQPAPQFQRGLGITGSMYQSGTFYADQIDVSRGGIIQTTGSYVMTYSGSGLVTYDTYQNVATALQPYISGSSNIDTSSFATTGSNTFNGIQTILETGSWGGVLLNVQSGSIKFNGQVADTGWQGTGSIFLSPVNLPHGSTKVVFQTEYQSGSTNPNGWDYILGIGRQGDTFAKTVDLGTDVTLDVSRANLVGFPFTTTASFNLFSGSQYKTDSASFDSRLNSGAITASSIITASVSQSTITFTKGDNSTFSIVVADNSGSTFDTGSLVTTASFNSYTSSQDFKNTTFITTGSVSATQAITGSLISTGSLKIIGNQTITGSLSISSSIQKDVLVEGQLWISSSNLFATASTVQPQINVVGYGASSGQSRSGSVQITPQKIVVTRSSATAGVGTTTIDPVNGFSVVTQNPNYGNFFQGSGSIGMQMGVTDAASSYYNFQNLQVNATNSLWQDYNYDTDTLETWMSMDANFGGNNPAVKFQRAVNFTTGSNKQAGTATLNGGSPGTVTVSNSLVTANSIILLTRQDNGNTNAGPAIISAKSAGTFTITTNHNGDTGVIGWFIINNS